MHQVHPIHVFINKKKYDLDNPVQLGMSLKHLAGIPSGDVLFLQREGEDEVICNEATVTLKDGDHLHSQPAADYGLQYSGVLEMHLTNHQFSILDGPEGWSFLVITDFTLPPGFQPEKVQLLVKLPPTYPDAAPDMFWVHPEVQTPNGTVPRSTSSERILDMNWQRFSWHLANGAWMPGISDIRDYLRCVRARFLRLD